MSSYDQVSPTGEITSRKDFKDTPQGQYKYWLVELEASNKNFRAFLRQGNRIVERYLATNIAAGERLDASDRHHETGFRLNLFYANTKTLMSTLYGSVPTIDVSRRYADSSDDVGRVAAEIMERLLNNDMQTHASEVEAVLLTGLQDRLTVGLGASRVRYDADFLPDEQGVDYENAVTDYVHWRDIRWGWARNFAEIPWMAFCSYLTKDEASKRFGEEIAEKLTYKAQMYLGNEQDHAASSDEHSDAWQKAEIWEIWDKRKREVVWISIGYDRVLETVDDPLQLDNFFPAPPCFIANYTSSLYIPVSDYHLAQDLYNEIDILQTRISIITQAVKVVGVYDSGNGEISRMLKEGTDNDLIPVENWALFGEKGGIQGQVDWLPIEDIVAALVQLIQVRDQTIALLQQVTGMNDLMRGDLANQYEGVGQTQIKAQFGSVRIQALQDQFAQYATDLMQIKAEVISKHCDPETIAALANVSNMPEEDQQLIPQAIQLIKDYENARLKIKIKPESIAMVDYAKLKNERTEYITALATFMQSAAPLVQLEATATPYLLKLLQWGLSGFKGSSEIEGVIDSAIEAAMKAQQEAKEGQQEPSAEEKMQQAEQQFTMQLEQFKAQAELQKIQAKAQADVQVRQADLQADMQTQMQEYQVEIGKMQVELINAMTEIKGKMNADIQKEEAQMQANIAQTQASAVSEIQKDAANAQIEAAQDVGKAKLDIETEAQKANMKLDEIAASAQAKIRETQEASKVKESADDG